MAATSSAPKVSSNTNNADSKVSGEVGTQQPSKESKNGCCLLNCCIGLVVLNFALLLVAFASFGYFTGANFGVGWLTGEEQTQNNPTQIADGTCSILSPANAGTEQQIGAAIDQWIIQKNPHSPLRGQGVNFAASGRAGGINPALIAGLALKESSLGSHIPDATFNPFGRTATASQPGVTIGTHKWYKFNSWNEAVLTHGSYIKRVFVQGRGITTVGKLMEAYCPRSECNTDLYISQLTGWMNEITTLAHGSLGAGCGASTTTPGTGGKDIPFYNKKTNKTSACLNSRQVAGPPQGPPMSDNGGRYTQVTLATKLEQLYQINKGWILNEACPPTYFKHASAAHYNGKAVDVSITPASRANIDKFLRDAKSIGFSYILDEYAHPSANSTGGHIHMEWRGN